MADKTLKFIIDAENRATAKLNQVELSLAGTQKKLESMKPAFETMAVAGTVAFAAIATAVGFAVKEYIQAEAAQNRLTQILRTSRGATDEQVKSLLDQANALEKVGVIQADSIVQAQAQLATFDLEASSIERLTPAILDYVVAEKGASATTDDLKQLTNGLAQALNGNFTSLTKTGFVLDDATKALIKNGTETQRTEALVKVLNSTYKGFNETARNTAEGSMIVLKNSFNNLQQEIGKAFIPALESVVKKITPIIEKITEWTEKHPEITRYIILLSGALAGLTAAIGVLGIAIIGLQSQLAILIGQIALAAGPISLLILALTGVAVVINDKLTKSSKDLIKEYDNLSERSGALYNSFQKLKDPIVADAEAIKDFAEKTEEANKKIADIQKNITNLIQQGNEDQISYNENKAQIFIDQEQKVADLQTEITEKTAEIKKAISDGADADRIAKLQKELADTQQKFIEESAALIKFKSFSDDIQTAMTEMRRRANNTEFQNKLEQLLKTRIAELQAYADKLIQYQQELADAQKQKDELMAQEVKYTKDLAAQEEERLNKKREVLKEMQRLEAEINAINARGAGASPMLGTILKTSTSWYQGRASGGLVTAGTPYIVGEQGPELFIPGIGGGTIIPNGVGGASIVLNISGPFYGEEGIADRIGKELMRVIKQNVKL